jgi:hypothetical protein
MSDPPLLDPPLLDPPLLDPPLLDPPLSAALVPELAPVSLPPSEAPDVPP